MYAPSHAHASRLTYAISGCPAVAVAAAVMHSDEVSALEVIAHSVMKNVVYAVMLMRRRHFPTCIELVLMARTADAHIVSRMHFMTSITSILSHNPGHVLITGVV